MGKENVPWSCQVLVGHGARGNGNGVRHKSGGDGGTAITVRRWAATDR